MKTFISQNINKIKLAPFPESIVLVATCTYHEGNDEFHAILQLANYLYPKIGGELISI